MLIDYHTHHERCGHAVGELREYIERAITLGISEIGLSDHMPVLHIPEEKLLPGLGMKINELEGYVKEVLDLKQEYKNDIAVKLGIEGDYIEGYEEQIEELLSPYPFDYIIGSVHFLGKWDISDSRQMQGWKERPIDDIFKDYYQAIQKLAKSGLYDIVGHFDVIKKFGHVPTQDMGEVIDSTLQAIKAQEMTMEINTSGLVKIVKEIYPTKKILAKAVDKKISFTLGSDAHKPEDVHGRIEIGRMLLHELGVKEIATFSARKRRMIPLTVE